MDNINKSNLHRAVKILIEQGKASSVEEGIQQLSRYRIGISIGKDAQSDAAGQSALLTAVNTAARVFLGGVSVYGLDPSTRAVSPLCSNSSLISSVEALGGLPSNSMDEIPIILIGDADTPPDPVRSCRLSYFGWSGGITPGSDLVRCCENALPLAPVLAASLGVASCFRFYALESDEFGNELMGISLADPSVDWLTADIPSICLVPASLWILGLGHLGQAYVWALGSFALGKPPLIFLQDFDPIEEANLSTGVLTCELSLGKMKTRVSSDWLESRGFTTRLIEKKFFGDSKLVTGEPRILLCGLDNLETRKLIEGPGFDLVIDAGLSPRGKSYDSFTVKSFCGEGSSTAMFSRPKRSVQANSENLEPYSGLGLDACGMRQLADVAVGVPFVGVAVSCLVLAEALRCIAGNAPIANLAGSLRNINSIEFHRFNRPFSKFPGYIELY